MHTRRSISSFTYSGVRLLAGLLSITVVTVVTAPVQATTFRIGRAKADITPITHGFPTMWLAGFASRGTNPASGVSAYPPQVRALAIKDSAGTKVIVSADLAGFTQELHEQISTLVQTRYGVQPANLLLNASHTHSGPVLRDAADPEVTYNLNSSQLRIVSAYTDWLRDTIVATIGNAVKRTSRTAIVSYGVGQLTGFARYRTPLHGAEKDFGQGDASSLTDLPVLAIQSKSGRMLAIVFSYAVHVVKEGAQLYNADFPGVAAAQLEAQFPGSMALFLQGAAGDLDPDLAAGDSVEMGTVLRKAVAAVITKNPDPITGPINTSYQKIFLPLDVYQHGTTLEQKNEETTVHTLLRQSYLRVANESDPSSHYHRHAKQMLLAIDNHRLPDTEPLPMQVWYFQDDKPVVLVGIGGELVSGYGLAIKALAQAKVLNDASHVWVTAYTNEVPGYIPSDEYLNDATSDSRNYEAGWNSKNRQGSVVADGSQVFYGQPARLKPAVRDASGNVLVDGVEQFVVSTVKSMVDAITP